MNLLEIGIVTLQPLHLLDCTDSCLSSERSLDLYMKSSTCKRTALQSTARATCRCQAQILGFVHHCVISHAKAVPPPSHGEYAHAKTLGAMVII